MQQIRSSNSTTNLLQQTKYLIQNLDIVMQELHCSSHSLLANIYNKINYLVTSKLEINQLNVDKNRIEAELQSQLSFLMQHSDLFVVDSLLKPFISEKKNDFTFNHNHRSTLASTFFENRHGFQFNELINAKFKQSPFLLNNQQFRTFKTKRSFKKETGESHSSVSKQKSDNNKTFLGFLSANKKSPGASASPNIDEKVKEALIEGYLYRDKQTDERKKYVNIVVKLFLFVFLLYILFSILAMSRGGNGSGSSESGGISDIRSALTGQKNFEINPEEVHVKFNDVKGLKEAKRELTEIVDFLRDPERFTRLGARLPKGILLVGPPGCGKTLLAKSIAGEAQVPFFQASGSDFDEMFVGTGSKRVRQLFKAARAKAPCVIFIDEIDSVGSKRSNSSVHPYANQTINQLLAEMDGFAHNEGIVVMGATNRRDALDNALVRPGRFDVEVKVDVPELKERIEILQYYLDKVACDQEDVDATYLAKQMSGMSGASIESVVNQAALRAVVENDDSVRMRHLEWALDRDKMGVRRERVAHEETNKNTAYHEAGHTIVAYFTKEAFPLHKVTILPAGNSAGHTAFVPDESQIYSQTKANLIAQMDVLMGGRVAEEMMFGSEKMTTGAYQDLKVATSIATNMVKIYGMSEKVGLRVILKDDEEFGPQSQDLLDQEVKKLLQESYDRAKNILRTHQTELRLIAENLLVHETLDKDQIKKVIETHKL